MHSPKNFPTQEGSDFSGARAESFRWVLAIPTYRRAQILAGLIQQVCRQTLLPASVIVIDGDPSSGEVWNQLCAALPLPFPCRYVPSNYGNLAYQRYLGWRAAQQDNADCLLYLDDDMILPHHDTLRVFWEPLATPDSPYVALTAPIDMGNDNSPALTSLAAVRERSQQRAWEQKLFRRFGLSRQTQPGGLTPAGNRLPPDPSEQGCVPVQWLRGGVMAFKMSALTQEIFTDDLFAITQHRCGLGEDTILARRMLSQGTLGYNSRAVFGHPHLDAPQAYPTRAFQLGYATAYSRRLINDNYRGLAAPHWKDRLALLRGWAGTSLLTGLRAIRHPRAHRFAYLAGYVRGVIQGIVRAPRAARLTPQIRWWEAAEQALAAQRVCPAERKTH